MEQIEPLLSSFFSSAPTIIQMRALKGGKIHKNYHIKLQEDKNSAPQEYLLQRVNHKAFPDPETLTQKIASTLDHLEKAQVHTPKLIKTQNQQYIHKEKDQYWRLFTWIPHDTAPIPPYSQKTLQQIGKLLSNFHRSLPQDIRNKEEELPFHQPLQTLIKTQEILQANPQIKAPLNLEKVKLNFQNYEDQRNKYPLHHCHNDPKIQNILFQGENHKPITLIDFDTLGPGWYFEDLADAIRSLCFNHLKKWPEQEIKALLSGYFQGLGNSSLPSWSQMIGPSLLILHQNLALRYWNDASTHGHYFNQPKEASLERYKALLIRSEIIEKELSKKTLLREN